MPCCVRTPLRRVRAPNGHQLRPKAKHDAPGPAAAGEGARRREVIENNKTWRAAEPVRLSFVTFALPVWR